MKHSIDLHIARDLPLSF